MILKKNILSYITNKGNGEFDPYYVYDTNAIIEKCRMFQSIVYENKSIHFASMANINPQFLRIVKDEKMDVFVNSVLHLEAAYEVGFRNSQMIFTSSALSEKIMKYAHGIGAQINLDSPNQLALWSSLFPGEPVGIRCNIGDTVKPYSTHAGVFLGSESRLGFTMDEIRLIADKSIIKGLHLYVGTDVFDINYFIDCYSELVKIAGDFPNLEYLNLGGGFGIPENGEKQFDFPEYNVRVTALMNEASKQTNRSLKLILEPGRIIGADAGYFVCQVTDIKNRPGKSMVGVSASTVQFSRPLLYDDIKHPVMIIRDGLQVQTDKDQPTTIYGCSTYSRDIFVSNVTLPSLRIGDIIVFGNAGSYCASSHMEFLGFAKPLEYFI